MVEQDTVAVIGLGYVGLPLALLAARKGYKVAGLDANSAKITNLTSGHSPVDGLTATDIAQSGVTYTTDFAAVRTAGIIIICVPTPVDHHLLPDLGPVKAACRSVGQYLQPGSLVILESTVNPGVSETVVLPELEAASGLTGGRDFQLAHCPERINPGDTQWNVTNIPRVVGSLAPEGLERAAQFYESIVDGGIHRMGSLKEAEAVKVVENSFRDINIAFVNELAMSFDKLGINVLNVIDGAATKPFAFMRHTPGCGVGGHCIPVDPYYLIEYARSNGFNHELLSLSRSINRRMPAYTTRITADMLEQSGTPIAGARVVVLGLSYKSDISDIRESPAPEIVKALKALGADVTVYDPYVPDTFPAKRPQTELAAARASGGAGTTRSDNYYETLAPAHQPLAKVLEGADAAVVATGHRLFREAGPALFAQAGVKVVIDGRACLNRSAFEAAGLSFKGIGH
jgi:UDP-N-acetyl-D-glucosamine dehydrogenase